ncbi:hypothetical protein B5S31_g2158 [[Candida] boidinii]|uniref:Unnamed protein product n=1 Tax=Candida boidinii TaxID=5477 RepID=A0ACB5TSK4_CANBO|nr:hypothetical protein B5S31_g2158 [[Candida] boidinii]GME94081.1 unnamed protein product [[Candida] boidinii]
MSGRYTGEKKSSGFHSQDDPASASMELETMAQNGNINPQLTGEQLNNYEPYQFYKGIENMENKNDSDGSEKDSEREENLIGKYEDSDDESEVPYSILTNTEKKLMSVILACVGLCSSISMPIYFPVLTVIREKFNITIEQVNLTVVCYLVFQAIAPVFTSTLADHLGRRPTILGCLIFGAAANIGLAVSNAYWLILFLRCCLAASVAPVISIGSGCVGDWVQRHERGTYIGIFSGFTLIGQGLAPFIGAVIDTWLGWRGIFWFSALVDGIVFLICLIFLPETKRSIVGNMSAKPPKFINNSPIVMFQKKRLTDINRSTVEVSGTKRKFNPLDTLSLLAYKQVFLTLIPTAILFSTWTMSQTTLTTILSDDYHYSTLKIGLCFFAPGMATIFGTLVSGRVIDYVYKRMKKQYNEKYSGSNEAPDMENMQNLQNNNDKDTPHSVTTPSNPPPFDLIRARLILYFVPSTLVGIAAIIYGWCVQKHVNVAPILVLAFIISIGSMYPLTVSSTLLVDLFPAKSATATSLVNLARCGLTSIFIACLDKMVRRMTVGGCYTFMGAIVFTANLMIFYLIRNSQEIMAKTHG